jgi:hypothetical protein
MTLEPKLWNSIAQREKHNLATGLQNLKMFLDTHAYTKRQRRIHLSFPRILGNTLFILIID